MTKPKTRVALVVPHIFMHQDILPRVIFSPGYLALDLAHGLASEGIDVTLFTPGPVSTTVTNSTADLSLFERELAGRDDTYLELLKKHPFTFVTLARQVQSEIVADAYHRANDGEFDIVHIYTNEEEIALPFASLCRVPVVFTHHDPFNFLVKYKSSFPRYKSLNWISMSYAQRRGMPDDTNWVGNVYHGIDNAALCPVRQPSRDYIAYIGRIIEPKGVHLAIEAVEQYNRTATQPLTLKIAGKHYADNQKDSYWRTMIEPELSEHIQYVGFIDNDDGKQQFLANASAMIVPSLFDEPFGVVTIESFACGTPVIALDSGALPEVINDPRVGMVVPKAIADDGTVDEAATIQSLAQSLSHIDSLDRRACRDLYEHNFTTARMCSEHATIYNELVKQSQDQS